MLPTTSGGSTHTLVLPNEQAMQRLVTDIAVALAPDAYGVGMGVGAQSCRKAGTDCHIVVAAALTGHVQAAPEMAHH